MHDDPNGIIVLDKPAGMSSACAVDAVKRLLPRGTKIGHAGTLDPFATGVLLLLIGRATKSCEVLMSQPKSYEATVKLGVTTETLDPESPEIPCEVRAAPPQADVERSSEGILRHDRSAPASVQRDEIGWDPLVQACARARPALPPRPVVIHRIELTRYDWPFVDMSLDCGRGTYVRSLARDLGEALGVGGYLTALRRTRIGEFDISAAVAISQLQRDGIAAYLRPPSG